MRIHKQIDKADAAALRAQRLSIRLSVDNLGILKVCA